MRLLETTRAYAMWQCGYAGPAACGKHAAHRERHDEQGKDHGCQSDGAVGENACCRIANAARRPCLLKTSRFFLSDLAAKQLGLLRELVPAAARIGLLVNPENANAESVTREVMAAATAIGVQIELVRASDRRAIEAAFAMLVRNKADALLVGADPFFHSPRLQLATLATRHALPAVYNVREVPEVGGLMSYGTSLTDVFQQVGVCTVCILKGAKPSDLPVVQSTRFELVINLLTARALGLDVPATLLARADEVIE